MILTLINIETFFQEQMDWTLPFQKMFRHYKANNKT